MGCIECSGWPDLEEATGCCDGPVICADPPVEPCIDEAVAEALWVGAWHLILRFVPCWQVCTHTIQICRPCGCPMSCNPCGCCHHRAQVPWLCATITEVSSQGVVLDPLDWNYVNGFLWPTSCSWPCAVDLTVEVGDVPPDALVVAAKKLWCMLAGDCVPGTCELPQGAVTVTGPDGVTVRFRTFDEWLAVNMTGTRLIDALVAAFPCPDPAVPRMLDPAEWARSTFR